MGVVLRLPSRNINYETPETSRSTFIFAVPIDRYVVSSTGYNSAVPCFPLARELLLYGREDQRFRDSLALLGLKPDTSKRRND